MTVVFVGFASVIAFGVIYNAARIGLSERGRETGQPAGVLGFNPRRSVRGSCSVNSRC